MKKFLAILLLLNALIASSFDDEINCASFDVKVALMGEEFLPSEIVGLYNNGSVSLETAGRPTFSITKDGFTAEYSASMDGARHTYTNMKKEKGSDSRIECSAIKISEFWSRGSEDSIEEKPTQKKIFYTITFDNDAEHRLVVESKNN